MTARYHAACHALGLPVWRPGMLALRHAPGCRDDGRAEVRVRGANDAEAAEFFGCVPDFTDPATLGCLVAAVREAWGVLSSALPNPYEAPGERWRVFSGDESGDEVACGPTEAEALIAALEAAARREGQP